MNPKDTNWIRKALGHQSPALAAIYVRGFKAYATNRNTLHCVGDWWAAGGYYCPYTLAPISIDEAYPDVDGLFSRRGGQYILKRGDFTPDGMLKGDAGRFDTGVNAAARFDPASLDNIFSISEDGTAQGTVCSCGIVLFNMNNGKHTAALAIK